MKRFLVLIGKVLLIVLLVAALGLIFINIYVFEVKPSRGSGSVIPPIQTLCGYEEGLTYSQYVDKPADWTPNNKFGLYVYAEDEDFLEIAQNLVNSSGGEWGYVLIPYNTGDFDEGKWGRVFDQLNAKKLIPIIQLWDLDLKEYKRDTKRSAEFLNRFVWPMKYRYIAVHNEPNDSRFWFDHVDPGEYAEVLDYTIDTFKQENPNFLLLNGGLNTSSPNDSQNMDAFDFIKAMNEKVPGIFEKLDGWASHSYPQPNFSGNPNNVGRWSVRAYDTELAFLKDVIGVEKELPVFITETGWAHAEGKNYNPSYLPVETVGEHFKTTYERYWLPDERVRAVIAFTIWYDEPYDHFSWVNQDKVPYGHFNVVKSMKKIKGKPPTLKQSTLMLNVCNVQK